jgi:hypothetical protein
MIPMDAENGLQAVDYPQDAIEANTCMRCS